MAPTPPSDRTPHRRSRRAAPIAALAIALAAIASEALVVATPARAQPGANPEPPHAALTPEIAEDQFATRAAILASEEFQGRESGTPGGRMTEDYVASEFARFGLEPAGAAGTPFQDVPLPWRPVLDGESGIDVLADGETPIAVSPLQGAVPFSTCAAGDVEAGVVFAGFGVSDADVGYDDWAGIDVRGKIVLVLRHGPRVDRKDSPWYLRRGDDARLLRMSFAEKAKTAAKAGAVGILFVNHQHLKDQALPTTSPGEAMTIPAMAIGRDTANRILRGLGKELLNLETAIDRDLTPRSADVPGVRVRMRCALGTPTARNVLFRLRGSDPALAKETVVVGAHLDHVGLGWFGSGGGAGARGQIHNGADDNGSGTAALLEIAEALAAGPAPRRSVVFAAWCGEEKGLIGSERWCKSPTTPLADVVANVNLDMVGRYRDTSPDDLGLGCVGAPTGTGLREKVDALAGTHRLRVSHTWDAWEQSDHFSFYQHKIPVLFLHTGLHPDYHKPGDDWWKLESKGAARVARLTADVVRAIADDAARPEFREKPKRAVLGVAIGGDEDDGGAVLGQVFPARAAANAGLLPKDVIVEADGKKVRTWADLSRILAEHRPGDVIDVKFRRAGETKGAKVTLSGI